MKLCESKSRLRISARIEGDDAISGVIVVCSIGNNAIAGDNNKLAGNNALICKKRLLEFCCGFI